MAIDLEALAPRVRTMQIIVASMTLGCAAVLITMFFLRDANAPRPATPMLTYAALAFSGMMVLSRFVVTGAMAAAGRKQLAGQCRPVSPRPAAGFGETRLHSTAGQSGTDEEQPLLGIFQSRTIVGAALLEGAVFFLAIAYLQEGHVLALAVGAALTLAVAAHFPTAGGVAAWVTDQQERMRQERFQ